MVLLAASFQDGFLIYNVYYDIDTAIYTVEENNPGYIAYTKQLQGSLYSNHCVRLEQYLFYAKDNEPYASVEIIHDSPYCGYNPSDPGSPLLATTTPTNESAYQANDGKVILNITGGTAPYLYSFDNANFNAYVGEITGLSPGNYNVTIQDQGGLQTTTTFTINAVAPIQGCMSPSAVNYNPAAQVDNGTCIFPNLDLPENRQNIYETIDQFRLIDIEGNIYEIEMPQGFEEVVFTLKRDPKYHGVNYEFADGSILLDFDLAAGKEILQSEYDKNGNDGYMKFQFGVVYPDGTFLFDIDCFVDFNTKNTDVRDKFSVSVKTKRFNDAIETKNEVDVTIKDGYFNMPLHSKEIRKQTIVNRGFKNSQLDTLGNNEVGDPNPNAPAPGDAPFLVYWNFLDFSKPQENESGYSSYINDLIPNPPLFGTSQSNPVVTSQYLFVSDGSGDFTFNIAFSLRFVTKVLAPLINDSRTGYWSYAWYLVINTTKYELPGRKEGFTNSRFNNVDFTTSYNVIHHLNQGDRVYLFGQYVFEKINTPGGFEGTIQLNYMNVNIVGNTLAAPTTSLSKLAFETVQDILTDISEGEAKLVSNLLGRTDIGYAEDGCASLIAYTNGYLIRGFPIEKRPLIAKLKDIIEGLDANFAIGMGYELNDQNQWVYRVEQLEHFYTDELIMVFDNVSNYEEPIDTSLIYNELTFGYEKYTQELENVSTIDEFLTKHNYLTEIKSYKGKFERICKQIAAGYAIELTRRKPYLADPNVSWTYDDDNFIISTVRDAQYGFIPEKLENFTASEILSPETAYNLRLTVTRMAARWAKWINSSLAFKTAASIIKNTFTAKNGDLTSQYTGDSPCESKVEFVEAQDLLKGQLANAEQLFFPEKISFTTKLSWERIREIRRCFVNKDPLGRNNGYFGVIDANGVTKYGYLTSMEYNPLSEEVKFVLRKKYVALNDPFDCSEYTFYTFEDFEQATGLPKEIEQCLFENFA